MASRGRRLPNVLRLAVVATAFLTIARPAFATQQTSALPARDGPLSGAPETLYSIGTFDGEPWEEFSEIRGVGFDRHGSLFVLDGSARLFEYGRDGRFVAQLAGEGEGPGEITFPVNLAVGEDGSLAVVDPAAGFLVFGPTGEFARTVGGTTRASGTYAVLLGRDLFVTGGTSYGLGVGASSGDPIVRQPLGSDAPAEVIYEAAVPNVSSSSSSGGPGGWGVALQVPPRFSPALRIAAAGNSALAVVSGTDWQVEIIDTAGAVARILRRPLSGRRAHARDREIAAQAASGGEPASRLERRAAALLEDQPLIADTIPAIRDVRGDGAGVLFVARETDPIDHPLPPIDVVTVDGRYLGTLEGQALPAALGPERLAAYVEVDELDIPRVVVRRLPASWFGD